MESAFNRPHLVQLNHPNLGRRVAVVDGDELRLLKGANSVYELANLAISKRLSLSKLVAASRAEEALD